MQASFRDAHVFGHGAIDPVTKSQPAGIEVIGPTAAEGRQLINYRRRFADDAIPFFKMLDSPAGPGNLATEFMAQDDGIIDFPTGRPMPLVQVAATNAGC